MQRRDSLGALLLSSLLLAGAGSTPAEAGLFQKIRAAHERHVQAIKNAHQRHVRFVERAHERHVRHAPEPVRRVDRAVTGRHRQHRRAHVEGVIERVDHHTAARRAQHARFVDARHAAHRQTLAGAGVPTPHESSGPLQRLADWLVGT